MDFLISIVVPMYNAAAYIGRCLQSLAVQTYKNIEIIVVNDGSTDGSQDIAAGYAAADSRIKIFHKPNGGLTSAVAYGIGKAAGEYTAFVDADDFVGEDYINAFAQNIGGADILAAGFYYEKDGQNTPFPLKADKTYNKEDIAGLINGLFRPSLEISNEIFVARWNKLYKTSLVRDISEIYQKINLSANEDTYFTVLALLSATSVKTLAAANTYYYCLHGQTMTRVQKPYSEYVLQCQKAEEAWQTVRSRFGSVPPVNDGLFVSLGMTYIKNYSVMLPKDKAAKAVSLILKDANFKSALRTYSFAAMDFKSKIKYMLFRLGWARAIVFFMKK